MNAKGAASITLAAPPLYIIFTANFLLRRSLNILGFFEHALPIQKEAALRMVANVASSDVTSSVSMSEIHLFSWRIYSFTGRYYFLLTS